MNDLLITTMPIKPQLKTNVGMLLAPLITEVVAKNLNIRSILSTNVLHSYKNNENLVSIYEKSLEEMGITYDSVFVDADHTDFLLECINELIEKKYIVEKENEVLICPCGKVDILKDGLRNFDSGDLYIKNGEDYFCKSCGEKCEYIRKKGLYLYLDPNINYEINIIPKFLASDFTHFYKTLPGKYLLVSKNRDTGYKVKSLLGNEYNIDIDLLWMNYVQCFEENNQILIASNHQLFEMFILNYINNMFGNKNLSFIATPYMNKTDLDINLELSRYDDILYKKLIILYTLKWKKKNCNWDETIFKGIAKLGKQNREKLYNIIINEFENFDIDLNDYINDLLINHICMPKNIKTLKKNDGGRNV